MLSCQSDTVRNAYENGREVETLNRMRWGKSRLRMGITAPRSPMYAMPNQTVIELGGKSLTLHVRRVGSASANPQKGVRNGEPYIPKPLAKPLRT